MLRFSKLAKAYGLKVLLDDVDLDLPASGRIALIGANGSGKTTLLNIIAGQEPADGGSVIKTAAYRVGYLPQQPNPVPQPTLLQECISGARSLFAMKTRMSELLTVLHELPGDKDALAAYEEMEARFRTGGGYAIEARASEILTGLGFAPDTFDQDPRTLSGGYRMRLELGRIFLDDPDALILDEPTNHLDLPSLAWTEQFLQRYRGMLLFVSHDRVLLNRLAQVSLYLAGGRLTLYQGNFDAFLQQREAELERNEAMRERLAAQRKNYERFVARFGAKATKAAQARSRVKMIARLKLMEQSIDTLGEESGASISFSCGMPSGRVVLRAQDLAIGYDRILAAGLQLTVERGQRIAVIGANGIGKSTLIKTVAGGLAPKGGEVVYGHQVRLGYFAQDPAELFDPRMNLLGHLLAANTAMTEREARALLATFLFRDQDVFKNPGVLSGGEKNRLAMALLLARRPNFMVLDEPTNHLDMQSVELLISALSQYEGTLLFVSHNRDFIDALCTHILVMLGDGRHALFHGQLEDYRRQAALSGFPDVLNEPAEKNTVRESAVISALDKKLKETPTNEEIRQWKSLRQKLKKNLDQLESSQGELREKIAALHAEISTADPKDYQNLSQIQENISTAENLLAAAEEQWLGDSDKLEQIERDLAAWGRL